MNLDKPSREVDKAIDFAMGRATADRLRPGNVIEGDRSFMHSPPAYSSSIDAALTLVPEGWETAIYLGGENCIVQMETEAMRQAVFFEPIEATAPTPALAICRAALKARGIE